MLTKDNCYVADAVWGLCVYEDTGFPAPPRSHIQWQRPPTTTNTTMQLGFQLVIIFHSTCHNFGSAVARKYKQTRYPASTQTVATVLFSSIGSLTTPKPAKSPVCPRTGVFRDIHIATRAQRPASTRPPRSSQDYSESTDKGIIWPPRRRSRANTKDTSPLPTPPLKWLIESFLITFFIWLLFFKLNVAFFSHWRLEAHIAIATPNIGGDIPIHVPTNQNIGGNTSPASPAGLSPMVIWHV